MDNKIEVGLKEIYWFLVAGCRYGYTRNNHLEPSNSFSCCEKYLPIMLKADNEWALYTAKQLVDECISFELMSHFFEGDDDESENRKRSIEFIDWLLKWIKENGNEFYRPYNYDSYLSNLALDDKPQYLVFELFGCDWANSTWESEKLLNKNNLLSKNNYFDFICEDVCGLKERYSIAYNKIRIDGYGRNHLSQTKFIYRILLDKPRVFLVRKKRRNKNLCYK